MTYNLTIAPPVADGEDGAPFTSADREARAKVLILIERRALVRGLLSTWLASLGQGFEVINVADAEKGLPSHALGRATLVILGVRSGVLSDAWLDRQVAWVRANRPDVPMAAIMDPEAVSAAVGSARGGPPLLQGYIPTSSSVDVAAAALHLVAAGGIYIPPSDEECRRPDSALSAGLSEQASSSLKARLTPRERAVLDLLEQGMANKVIAYRLGTSQSTVKAHVHSIISKLNVRNRTEAATASSRR